MTAYPAVGPAASYAPIFQIADVHSMCFSRSPEIRLPEPDRPRSGKRLIRFIYRQQNRGLGARHPARARGGTERSRADVIRQVHN